MFICDTDDNTKHASIQDWWGLEHAASKAFIRDIRARLLYTLNVIETLLTRSFLQVSSTLGELRLAILYIRDSGGGRQCCDIIHDGCCCAKLCELVLRCAFPLLNFTGCSGRPFSMLLWCQCHHSFIVNQAGFPRRLLNALTLP